MAYQPVLGDRVRVTVEGPITNIDGVDPNKIRVGSGAGGSATVVITETVVISVEKVVDPEPPWSVGDVVLADDDRVYVRIARERWARFDGRTFFNHEPKRPLELLVRNGVKQ